MFGGSAMSDHFTFHFDFGLDTTAPDSVLSVFRELADGRQPNRSALASFPLGSFLDPELMMGGQPFAGSTVTVRATGISNNSENPYHAPMPAHAIRFSFSMHDDYYANGGYILPLAVFDLVGEHGLFGVKFVETGRTSIDLYFKEFDDLIIQSLEAPSMAYPLPPNAATNRKLYLKDWKPAIAGDFKLSPFTRLTPADRAQLVAEANDMMGFDDQ
jgi:hypothetical protein